MPVWWSVPTLAVVVVILDKKVWFWEHGCSWNRPDEDYSPRRIRSSLHPATGFCARRGASCRRRDCATRRSLLSLCRKAALDPAEGWAHQEPSRAQGGLRFVDAP